MPEVKNWQVSDLYLRFKVANGIEKKLKGKVPQNLLQETYMPRIKMECDVFQKVGISDYFLILHDMALWCRKNNIPTNYSRGSAGGCLASYLLDITMIDPIPCDLSFERFYNVGRMETRQLPDIDFDVSQKHRDRIISEYIIPTYGERFVSPIGTRGTLQSKGAVKDIGRVLSIPIDDTEAISQMMGMTRGKVEMMKEALEEKDGEAFSPRAQRLHEWRRRYPELFKYVLMIEEMETIRTTSVHAAGIIISPTPVGEYIPLTWNAKKQIACTGYDMYELKNTGAVKIDVLGIRNLDIVQETMERAGINEKYHDFVERIPTDDEKTWRLLQKGNGVGVFQFESPFMRRILSDIKPEKIADLSDITALGRPGPLDARIEITDEEINFLDTGDLPPYLKGKFKGGKNVLNMIEVYVARKKGELKVKYAHPLLEPIVSATYGVFCVDKETRVTTQLGRVAIKDLAIGDLVKTETGEYKRVVNKFDQGIKSTIRVRASFGEEIVCTPEHKILTSRGWKEARELRKGDLIKGFWAEGERTSIGDERDWVIGMLLADGDICSTTPTCCCGSLENAEKIKIIADRAFGLNCHVARRLATDNKKDCYYLNMSVAGRGQRCTNKHSSNFVSNPLRDRLKQDGLLGLDCYHKFLPQNFTLQTIIGFIEGDGCLFNKTIRLKNRNLAYGLYLALHSYRIPASFHFDESNGVSCVTFYDYNRIMKYAIKKEIHASSSYYVPREYLGEVKRPHNDRRYCGSKERLARPMIEARILQRHGFEIKHPCWGSVLSVKPNGDRHVFDISVEDIHSFVGGGLVLSNCYQEQISKSAVVLAGYTPAEADGLRKIMGNKLTEKIAAEEPKFLSGCEKNGIDQDVAMKIWKQMRTFAEYGFNKCLAAGTEVITPDGIKNIEDLTTEDHVLSLSTGSDVLSIHSKPCWRKVVGVYPQGKQECVRVRTNCGAITHATKNHLFPTEHGFKMAEELSQRDCLFVSHFAPLCLTDEIDNGTAMLMGYVLGGKYNKNEDHHNLWFRDKQLPSMVRKDTDLRHKDGIFRLAGDMPDTKADLALDVSCFSEESLKLFLRSFCRASFMITIDPYCILPTERLCKQMQLAFLHYGILTSIAHRTKDDCFTLSLRGARSKLIFQDIFLGEMTNRQQRRWKAILHPSTCAEAYVRIDKVHSVYDVGALETYDIEVEGNREEEHVFFGDLILTHNSHSVGYSTLSYATAYMKTNHPAEFMASLISSDKDKEKRAQWIHEARDVLGLKVEAPNINSSELDFVANKNSIIYGLSEINGMGTVAVRAILEARKDGPFGSLEDFYDRVDLTAVNSARYRVLVLSGAMRDLHQNHAELLAWDEMLRNSRDKVKSKKKLRQENIAEYEEILRHQNTDDYVNKHITMAHKTQVEKGKKTMEEIRKEVAQKYLETTAVKLTKAKQELEEYSKPCTLPTSISLPNMSLEELMKAEEEVLGVQISGTIASPYVNEISMYSDTTIADVKDPEFDLKYWGNFCGVLTGIRESMVKNGKTKGEMMAFAKFTDLTGSIDLLIFPKAYSACKSFLLERKPICVRGKKSERGDSLIAFEISEV